MREHVGIVIPAYNEERTIGRVIHDLKARGFTELIVVDDGSDDKTGEIARQGGAVLVRHIVNRGLGASLGTGIEAALRFNSEIIVTVDADGQHDPRDVPRLLKPIENGEADIVIGSRMLNPSGMPWHRCLANHIANLVTYVLFGVRVSDSQSGLRALSRSAAASIRITAQGMEVSSEIVAEIWRNRLRCIEVPVHTIYTSYSLSKGQSFAVGLHTLVKLIQSKLRRSDL